MILLVTLLSVSVLMLTACNTDSGDSGKKLYKITFMDGDEVVYTREVAENTAVLYKPENEPGRTFLGWFTDKELTEPFDGSRGITGNITVYGKWYSDSFTVTFTDSEGNVIKTETVDYGDDAVPPEADEIPEIDGYEFSGWSGSYENITADVELKAEYTKLKYIGKLSFVVNGETVLEEEGIQEGQSLARYFNEANLKVEVPGYILFNSVWADADGNVVSGSSEFGDEDMVLYARLSLAESLDLSKYDGYSEGISSGAEGFDAAAEYGGDVTTSLGYVLSGTAYKDVEYSFAWYFNEGEEAIADFSDDQSQNRYWEKHLFDFGGSDRLSFTNVGEPGVNAGRLQIIESWGFPVGEYYGLYKLVMTVTPKEETGFGDLGTYTREIEWNFKIMPKDFTVKYNNVLESVEYDGEAHAVNASTVFPENALGSGDVAAFSFDGENYSETLEMTDAGSYKIYFKVSRENHNDFTDSAVFEILAKPITVYAVKPADKAYYYGETPSYEGFGYMADGIVEGDLLDISSAEFKGLPQKFGTAGIQYTVYIGGGISDNNYAISYATVTADDECNLVTVEKRPVAVTVAPVSVVYGTSVLNFTPALAEAEGSMGFAPGESFDNLIDPRAYNVGWDENAERHDVGEYSVTPDYSNYNGNYDIIPVPGVLTVTAAELSGYISSAETQYLTDYKGRFEVTFPSLIADTTENDYVQGCYGYSFKVEGYNRKTAVAGDEFAVSGSAVIKDGYAANYNITLTEGKLTVTKAVVTVSVTQSSGVQGFSYGVTAAEITKEFSVSAMWLQGEAHFDALEITTNYAEGMDAGEYYVAPVQVKELANYQLNIQKTYIEVQKRPITVTLRYGTISYGDDFDDSFFLSGNTMVYGDQLGVKLTSDYVAGDPVGTYTVTPVFTVNGSGDYENYEISLTDDQLKVNKRSVTLSLSETARLNVGHAWEGTITAADNLYDGDTVSVSLQLAANASGTYEYSSDSQGAAWTVSAVFTRSGAADDVSGNYDIEYNVTVTILSVSVEHTLKPDFSDQPADTFDFEVTYDKKSHYVTVSVAGNIADAYTVGYSLSNGNDANYTENPPEFTDSGTYTVYYRLVPKAGGDIEQGSYTLTILKRELTVGLEDQEIYYGSEFVYEGSPTVTGLADGDAFVPAVSAKGYSKGSGAGEYPLYVLAEGGGVSPDIFANYKIVFNDTVLTVKPEEITVSVSDVHVAYGENAVLNYKITSGILYGSDALYLYSEYAPGKPVGGDYAIKVKENANYTIDANDARVIVSKKEVTVSVSDLSVQYGGAVPEYVFTATGLYQNDADALTAVSDYTSGSDVAEYAITVALSDAAAGNYTIVYSGGSAGKLTVLPMDVSVLWVNVDSGYVYNGSAQTVEITADKLSKPYGGELNVEIDDTEIIVTYYKNGAVAEFINAGSYTVKVDLGANFKIWNPEYTFVMDKAVYDADGLDAIDIAYRHDRSLADIAAPENLSWVNPNEVPVPGKTSYAAKVTNENFYAAAEISVTINVSKAAVSPVSVYTLDFVAGKKAVLPEQIPAVYVEGSAVEIPLGTLAFVYGTDSFDQPGSYKTTVSLSDEGSEYYMMTEKVEVYVKVAAVSLNGIKYTIEDALYNSKSGDTITLTDKVDITFTSGAIAETLYNDSGYYTVKAGVTLILPSTADTAGIGGTTYMNRTETRYVDEIDSYINMKLTVPEGISLTVYGNVLVRGGLGSASTGTNGHTSDNHSQIINDGEVIVYSGGLLDMKGFIKGAGTLSMQNGSQLYAPFVVLDYRGGTNTVLAYRKGKIAPFRIYDMPNTQCKVVYEYGSVLKAYFDLYANSAHNNMDDPVTIIGPGSGAIFNMSSGARIIYETYDDGYDLPVLKSSGASNGYATTDKHSVTLLGNITLGSLKLEIKLSIISATVDMNEVFFPVSYLYDIIVGDGMKETVLTANARYKFMPGATLTVKKNATVNIGGQLIFYGEGYEDDMTGFNEEKTYYKYPVKLKEVPAELNLDGGTLNVTGTLAAAVNATDGGRLIMASGAGTSITTQEGHSGKSSSTSALLNTGTMTLHDVSVTSTLSDGTAVSAGKTYVYSDNKWSW